MYGSTARGRRVDDVSKKTFSIPASHVSRGGAEGVKQLRAVSAQAELSQWNKAKPKALVRKGVLRQGTKPFIARVNPNRSARRVVHDPRQVVGKASLNGLKAFKAPGAFKGAGSSFKSGLSGGRTGATPLASPAGAGSRAAMGAGRLIGANPGKAGLAAGAGGMGAMSLGNGRKNNNMAPMAPMGMYGGFGKRSYDPEGERRFRQGAAAAATGVGAAALGNSARRGIKDDTARTRDLVGRKSGNPKGAAAVSAEKARVARLKSLKGVTVTGRSGLKGAGAAGLLGLSGALFNNRNEPRWD